uniref:Uncharacterized protein n=1 Tax=Sphaerodactylus townsendi TaxID=933632 RepID=A0ACB8ELM2_9SAUR
MGADQRCSGNSVFRAPVKRLEKVNSQLLFKCGLLFAKVEDRFSRVPEPVQKRIVFSDAFPLVNGRYVCTHANYSYHHHPLRWQIGEIPTCSPSAVA